MSYILSRCSSTLTSNGKAVYVDIATKKQLIQAKTSDASIIYAKMKQDKPVYFGTAVNDQYLGSFISEITDLIKDLNIVDILKRFPQTQAVTKMMTVEKLKQIMPEVA